MGLLQHGAAIPSGASAYDIDNSVQMNSVTISNPPRFNRTNSSAGNRKTFTISFWHKRGVSAHSNTVGYRVLNSIRNESGKYPGLFVFDYRGDVNSTKFLSAFADEDANNVAESWFKSDMSFRDEAAWYHIVIAYDTTQGTASNRRSMYVNGVEQTTSQNNDIPQHHQSSWNDDTLHCIGAYEYNLSDASLGGYLAEVHNIDGLKLDASSFGEFDEDTGIWKPKEYDGNYGTNGFRLQFKETGTSQNASGLGADTSGNDHHFATVGHTAASQATDTPTNNFCTLNRLHMYSGTSSHNPIVDQGATRFTTGRSGYWAAAVATMGLTSGKWYFEAQPGTSDTHITTIGYGDESDIHDWAQDQADTNGFPGENGTNSIGYLGSDTSSSYGNIWLGTGSTSNVNANYTISNIVGVAIDADNGFVYFAKDNTYVNSGNPGSGANGTGGYEFEDTTTTRSGTVFPSVGGYYHTAATVINVNFGGYTTISISSAATDAKGYGTFEYAPPSGYYALCTKNLAEYG